MEILCKRTLMSQGILYFQEGAKYQAWQEERSALKTVDERGEKFMVAWNLNEDWESDKLFTHYFTIVEKGKNEHEI